jgi:hypothetical protein
VNKIMFAGGLCIAITCALRFVFVDTKESVSLLTVLAVIGIVLIGASAFRMMKT